VIAQIFVEIHFRAHHLAPRGSLGKKLVKSDSASHIVDGEAGKIEGKTEACPIL
jgi:hypothetical protein